MSIDLKKQKYSFKGKKRSFATPKKQIDKKKSSPYYRKAPKQRRFLGLEGQEMAMMFVQTGISLENREIYLTGDVDDEMSAKAITAIKSLIKINNQQPIDVYINSYGGDPYSAFAVYDFMKSLIGKVTIRTHVSGTAMSAGSIILMGGHERYCSPNSVIMIHSVQLHGGVSGRVHELKEEYEECTRIHNQMCKLYSENTELTEKQWDKKLKYSDIYIRHDEALDLGIIHGTDG